ncbi:MAG TPA: hypothetical protein VK590_05530 [Saprospiraceae bacterium]|nr:hypothetical protein [Saprospiraceae bacterium]
MIAYKSGKQKALVMGLDKYYKARKKGKKDPFVTFVINYIDLNEAECKSILDHFKTLQEKIDVEKTITNEEVYHDFTVSQDFFISYSKSNLYYSKDALDLWIKGERYTISTSTFVDQLNKFMAY